MAECNNHEAPAQIVFNQHRKSMLEMFHHENIPITLMEEFKKKLNELIQYIPQIELFEYG